MPKRIPVNLKYQLYEESVQNSEGDIEFINEEFLRLQGRQPLTLREDFCGTGLTACSWVEQSKQHLAKGIDLDKSPINYGRKNHYIKLNTDAKKRMDYIQGNVLDDHPFKSDVIVAFNFSYFVFKKKKELVNYFKKALNGLEKKGALFLDIFGGTECFQELEETTEYGLYDYVWDCHSFNPITNEVIYYIHFKDKKNNVMYKKAFLYDWRHWTIPEVVECMEEAGFSNVRVYWEEEDEVGEGSGEFYESPKEENCESWIAYIVGLK